MNGTTFPSNPCYLPIFEDDGSGLRRYAKTWRNFVEAGARGVGGSGLRATDRIVEYNGRAINDVIVFDSEQDMMWFILRWS